MCSGESEGELPESEVVRRVALDIGSNASKCVIADVDLASGSILATLHAAEVPCSFAVAWKASPDGSLGPPVLEQGLRVLNAFARKATALGATQKAAIATEVFRKAKNGGEYLARVRDELGLHVQLVDQEMEARLGFLTAAAYGCVDRSALISWDSGGASFQFSTIDNESSGTAGSRATRLPRLKNYLGALGVGVATCICVEAIQLRSFAENPSPNPMGPDDATKLVSHLQAQLPPPPGWLVGSRSVVAIGGPNSMFALAASLALGPDAIVTGGTICPAQVWEQVESLSGLSDEDLANRQAAAACLSAQPGAASTAPSPAVAGGNIPLVSDPPSFVLPKLCLLYAVLDFLQLSSLFFQPAIGSCAGMLVEETLWETPVNVMREE
eukprot:scaffold225368_cov26-Tisochrysis_lutea.AAC.1